MLEVELVVDVEEVVGSSLVRWAPAKNMDLGSSPAVTVTYTMSVSITVFMTRLSLMGLATARMAPAATRKMDDFIFDCLRSV